MRSNRRALMVLLANLAAIAILTASASVVMLRPAPAGAEGKPVDPDSIAMTRRLDTYRYDRENSYTLLVTATFTRAVYLVKDDHTVLADATVGIALPRYGILGQMTPKNPGEYGFTTTERIRVRSPLPLLTTRDWRVEELKIEVDGRDETNRVVQTQDTISAFNFERVDLTGAHLGLFTTPKTYTLTTNRKFTFRVVKANGQPAANLTAEIELPDRNYRETITTDSGGWVEWNQPDEVKLTISGGQMVGVDGPQVIYMPEDPNTLYWWEEPTPRCEMEFRTGQKRLATQPGLTAQFGFEVINRGNQPDDYQMTVTGVPEEWMEVEYGGQISLYPWFGQIIYVNVTPERSYETRMQNFTLTATVTSSCDQQTATAVLKVQEFQEPRLDIFDPDLAVTAVIAADVRSKALGVSEQSMLDLIIRADGSLPDNAAFDVEKIGGAALRELELIDGLAVRVPAGKLLDLQALPWVGRIDSDRKVEANLKYSVPALGAPQLWNLGYDGTGVKVAVVDTGVDYNHPFLAGHVTLGPDFAEGDADPMDVYGHGTHVAGIIASRDQTYKGVAPGAEILAVRVLDDEGSGTISGVIAGLDWAVRNGADVVNLSLGAAPSGGTDPLSVAVDNAVKSGVLVVVSAGNNGPDFNTVGSPGDARLALTVGAAYVDKTLVSWSSRGPTLDGRTKPDLIAPGALIFSSVPGGGIEGWSGTSMSAPHVSGLGALLIQATGAEPRLVKEALMKTAYDPGDGPNNSGAGFPEPAAALTYLKARQSLVQKEAYPGETVTYNFTLMNNGNADDRFRLSHWIGKNGLKYQAQPTLPQSAIHSTVTPNKITSGQTVTAQVQVTVPKDWIGAEDAVYTFYLSAASRADRNAVDVERATLKVKATGGSAAGYGRQVLLDLMDRTSSLRLSIPARQELLIFEEALAEASGKAADQTTPASLAEARTRAGELQNRIDLLLRDKAIRFTDAQRLQADLDRAVRILIQAEGTN